MRTAVVAALMVLWVLVAVVALQLMVFNSGGATKSLLLPSYDSVATCSPFERLINGSGGVLGSQANPVPLTDILVMMSHYKGSHISAVLQSWGGKLLNTHSLELFTLTPSVSTAEEPVTQPYDEKTFPGLMTVQWSGSETGIFDSMALKVKKQLATALQRHPKRKWFVKADDDTLVAVQLLRRLLAMFPDPDQPLFMGYTWPAGAWGPVEFNSGALYILSRGALAKIGPLLQADPTAYYNEDVMVAQVAARAGIKPLNISPLVHYTTPDHRVASDPSTRYQPFVAFHKIKNEAMLIQLGLIVDALLGN